MKTDERMTMEMKKEDSVLVIVYPTTSAFLTCDYHTPSTYLTHTYYS